jgi:hypothetical protein
MAAELDSPQNQLLNGWELPGCCPQYYQTPSAGNLLLIPAHAGRFPSDKC